MANLALGAMLLHYSVGRWSDRKDRSQVLTILTVACTALSLVIVLLPSATWRAAPPLFLWRRGKRPVPANPAPFAEAPTFSPTGAEL